ncbi:MAG: ligase-associated DNA damage response endonuclease PdeM [Amaricoccus sp.]|uniref:ligase-associated DNA damage response endonuclease PdeM n=1 Tax=Amaricoccus sp. TaxID=1872485 RepID=UPI0039E47335
MSAQPLVLAGAPLLALASGALFWPAERLLCVADLHLGKSERLARRGGTLLPPYETRATLDRLAAEIDRLAPARVICLGDSFDDTAAVDALAKRDRLAALTAGRDWIWIAGNHDPEAPGLPGRGLAEAVVGPLTFRHAACATVAPGENSGEVSGHYHPKLRLALGGRAVSRPCFLHDDARLILPAFGAYTGGLAADSPALARLLGDGAHAILTGEPCVTLPLAPVVARRAVRRR